MTVELATPTLVPVTYYDMLYVKAGAYFSRSGPDAPWVPTVVDLCGDEHGEENGFRRQGEPHRYFNEITHATYEWARQAASVLPAQARRFTFD